jgi:hypothetical protein
MHKDCPEKENASSTPACCNCQLPEGETAHPANYHGCRHAKEEMRKEEAAGDTQKHNWKGVFIQPS